MVKSRVLIIDNTIDPPQSPSAGLGANFRKYLSEMAETVEVRRAPEHDLPRDLNRYSHVILSGSKTSILDDSPWVHELLDFTRRVYELRLPLLGVCFGHQIIARTLGGTALVRKSATPEQGAMDVEVVSPMPLWEGLPRKFTVDQSHVEEVSSVPTGAAVAATAPRCAIEAYFFGDRPVFGLQFHPERSPERVANAIFGNFIRSSK